LKQSGPIEGVVERKAREGNGYRSGAGDRGLSAIVTKNLEGWINLNTQTTHEFAEGLEKVLNEAIRRGMFRSPVEIHIQNTLQESYEFFRKHFDDSILFCGYPYGSGDEARDMRTYAIRQAMEQCDSEDLFLEFGVFRGSSINLFAEVLEDRGLVIHGFDAFLGLGEDWTGHVSAPKGTYDRGGEVPDVRSNVRLHVGWVNDTVPDFLRVHNTKSIAFLHMDMDTYTPTTFVLSQVKPRLRAGAIILFDQLYGVPSWREHEYRALTERFSEREFEYIAFSRQQVAVRYLGTEAS